MHFRFLLLLLLPLFSQAQTGSLTVFSEQGDPFYLYLNGNKMNDTAVSKIRLEGLSGDYYTVKVDFKSASIQPVTKQLYLLDGNDKISDATYRIKKDKTGKARFTFYAMQTAESDMPVASDVKIIRFKEATQNEIATTQAPAEDPTAKTILSNVKGATVSTPQNKKDAPKVEVKKVEKKDSIISVKNVQTEATKKAEVKSVVKEDVKKAAPSKETKVVAKKEVKVEETKLETKKEEPNKPEVKKVTTSTEVVKTEDKKEPKVEAVKDKPVTKKDYPTKKCNDWPMMKADYLKARSIVETAKNDKQRLKNAMEMANENCLLVSQVSDVSNFFEDENVKLEFLKYAYGFIIDRNNFGRLEKLLTSPALIKEFKAFHIERTSE